MSTKKLRGDPNRFVKQNVEEAIRVLNAELKFPGSQATGLLEWAKLVLHNERDYVARRRPEAITKPKSRPEQLPMFDARMRAANDD